MSIYGRPSHRSFLEPELAWAIPQQRGFSASQQQQPGAGGSSSSGGKGKEAVRDPEMWRLLDGLQSVGEDERKANGVMVGRRRARYVY